MDRFDVTFEIPQRDATHCSLRTGEKVDVVHAHEGFASQVLTLEGKNLGSLSHEHASVVARGGYSGRIRTVKRDALSGSIRSVVVRFDTVLSSNDRREDANDKNDDHDGSEKLSRKQLQLIAEDEEIRRYLRDERLQTVLHAVDGAANPEDALERLMMDPEVTNFADKILDIVDCNSKVS